MIFKETELKGAFIIELKKLEDNRGFFARSWCKREFEEHGLNPNATQANVSYNKQKGILRGMHFQSEPYAETKLVRCVRGAIFDVIIDLRPESATYKKWYGVELSEDNYRMLYVPENYAHGFQTLRDNTEVIYQVTQYYTPGYEKGIRWDDPGIDIQWPMVPQVISEKDQQWPDFVR